MQSRRIDNPLRKSIPDREVNRDGLLGRRMELHPKEQCEANAKAEGVADRIVMQKLSERKAADR